MQWRRAVGVGVWVTVCAAWCSRSATSPEPSAEAEATPASEIATAIAMPVLDALDDDGLRARAGLALREQRIHAPAGNCAVDYYLALRERLKDDASARTGIDTALTELQPYVLIAAEQSLARNDLEETQRLLAMLARIDAHAPALPRLRDGLAIAQQKADAAESAQLQLARMETAPTVPAAATSLPRPHAAAPIAMQVATPPASPPQPVVPMPTPVASQPAPAPEPPTPPASQPVARAAEPAALPRLIADAAPRYPLAARNRRIEGRVQVAFTIEPDGSVRDARLVSAQPSGVFEEAALAAAARWRFEATGRRIDTTRTLAFALPPG